MKKYIVVLLLILFIIPSVALASWWNPFSWFHNWNFHGSDQEFKIPENPVKEPEKKLGDMSASKQTQNVVVPKIEPIKSVTVTNTTTQLSEVNKYDVFATCLKNKGAVFYGASWCSHCNNQKTLFGASKNLLPYVECSTPDSRGQTQICEDKGITGYPTWEFADGSRLTGELSFEKLSQKTSCKLP